MFWTILAAMCMTGTLTVLTLALLGCTYNRPGLTDWYFLDLDLSYIHVDGLPDWVAPGVSVAKLLGLHDFYTVGLWSYCAGFNDQGVVFCSKPRAGFWFNPVSILENELLVGAASMCILLPLSGTPSDRRMPVTYRSESLT
jgi:hypothetical protein